MNVFILSTGRCGTLTFIRACEHMENFSTGHESRDGRLGFDRFNYPVEHIEADPRLSWMLGRLDRYWGKKAFYVHLTRDKEEVAKSFHYKTANRPLVGRRACDHYAIGIAKIDNCYNAAKEYIDEVTANINLFLRDKPDQMAIEIERVEEQFPMFWERIGAQGDFDAAMKELKIRHNKQR